MFKLRRFCVLIPFLIAVGCTHEQEVLRIGDACVVEAANGSTPEPLKFAQVHRIQISVPLPWEVPSMKASLLAGEDRVGTISRSCVAESVVAKAILYVGFGGLKIYENSRLEGEALVEKQRGEALELIKRFGNTALLAEGGLPLGFAALSSLSESQQDPEASISLMAESLKAQKQDTFSELFISMSPEDWQLPVIQTRIDSLQEALGEAGWRESRLKLLMAAPKSSSRDTAKCEVARSGLAVPPEAYEDLREECPKWPRLPIGGAAFGVPAIDRCLCSDEPCKALGTSDSVLAHIWVCGGFDTWIYSADAKGRRAIVMEDYPGNIKGLADEEGERGRFLRAIHPVGFGVCLEVEDRKPKADTEIKLLCVPPPLQGDLPADEYSIRTIKLGPIDEPASFKIAQDGRATWLCVEGKKPEAYRFSIELISKRSKLPDVCKVEDVAGPVESSRL